MAVSYAESTPRNTSSKFKLTKRWAETFTKNQIVNLTPEQISSLDGYTYQLDIRALDNEQATSATTNISFGHFILTFMRNKGWRIQARHIDGQTVLGTLNHCQDTYIGLKNLSEILEGLTPETLGPEKRKQCLAKIRNAFGYPPEGYLCYKFSHQLTIRTSLLTLFLQREAHDDTYELTHEDEDELSSITSSELYDESCVPEGFILDDSTQERFRKLLTLCQGDDVKFAYHAYHLLSSKHPRAFKNRLKKEINQLILIGKRAQILQSKQKTPKPSSRWALQTKQPEEIKLMIGICTQEQNNILNCLAAVFSRHAQVFIYSYGLNPDKPLEFYQEIVNTEFQLDSEELYDQCLSIVYNANSSTMDTRYKKDIFAALAQLSIINANNKPSKTSLQWQCYEALQEHMANIFLTQQQKTELTQHNIPLITDAMNQARTYEGQACCDEFKKILAILNLKCGARNTLPNIDTLGKLLPQTTPSFSLPATEIYALKPYQLKILTPLHCFTYAKVLTTAINQTATYDAFATQRPRVGSTDSTASTSSRNSELPTREDDSFDGSDDSITNIPQPIDQSEWAKLLANKRAQILEQAATFCQSRIYSPDEIVLSDSTFGALLLRPTEEDRHYASLCTKLAEQIHSLSSQSSSNDEDEVMTTKANMPLEITSLLSASVFASKSDSDSDSAQPDSTDSDYQEFSSSP